MRKEAKLISKSIFNPVKKENKTFEITKLDIINYGYPESKCIIHQLNLILNLF